LVLMHPALRLHFQGWTTNKGIIPDPFAWSRFRNRGVLLEQAEVFQRPLTVGD
jgi:hypothetical protein